MKTPRAIRYPAVLERQEDGGYTVTFPDFPEAITEGDDREESLFNASEVLTLVLAQRMDDGVEIPEPSKVKNSHMVEPAASVQSALLLRILREQQEKSLAEFARALSTSWPAAQRLEQPRGNPTLRQLEKAAAALGKRLVVEMV